VASAEAWTAARRPGLQSVGVLRTRIKALLGVLSRP